MPAPNFRQLLATAAGAIQRNLGEDAIISVNDEAFTVIGDVANPARVIVHHRRTDGDGRADHYVNQPIITVAVFVTDYDGVLPRGSSVQCLADGRTYFLESPITVGDPRKTEYKATLDGGG